MLNSGYSCIITDIIFPTDYLYESSSQRKLQKSLLYIALKRGWTISFDSDGEQHENKSATSLQKMKIVLISIDAYTKIRLWWFDSNAVLLVS